MKIIMFGLIVLGLANFAPGADKAALDNRVRKLTGKLEAMQRNADKAIPAERLRKAHGIVLLDRTKAGFIFAFQGGGGVATVKDPKTGKWGPLAFVEANEASLGVQIGGEQTFMVILLMGTNATRLLTESHFEFGGEARGTAGDASAGEEGKVSSPGGSVLVFADRKGLYGGAAVKGGAITPDEDANTAYYGGYKTMNEILFEKKLEQSEAASKLIAKLEEYSKENKK